jgi:hypothetical protein
MDEHSNRPHVRNAFVLKCFAYLHIIQATTPIYTHMTKVLLPLVNENYNMVTLQCMLDNY